MRSRLCRTSVAAVIGVGLLALGACGDDNDASPSTPTDHTTTATAEPAGGTPTPDATAATAAETDLLHAAATAMNKVPGSQVLSIEVESGGAHWEVKVADDKGQAYEVNVSSVDLDNAAEPVREDDTSADRAKRRARLAAAELDHRKAVAVIAKTVKGGLITELGLDSSAGHTVWEADVMVDSTKHEVSVDAASGQILSNKVGD